MNTIDYLKRTKKTLGITSDYALAQRLELTRQAIGKLQKGATMSDETALKVAHILGIHPVIVLADAHAEREKNPEIQAVWLSVMEKFSMGFKTFIKVAHPRRIKLSA